MPDPPPASSAAVSAVMKGNRGRDTGPEREFRSHLHRLGVRYRVHARPEVGLRCIADVVHRGSKVAIFVDGCYWHGCPMHGRVPRDANGYWAAKLGRNQARDERNNKFLTEHGWNVLRFWEHDNMAHAARVAADAIQSRRP